MGLTSLKQLEETIKNRPKLVHYKTDIIWKIALEEWFEKFEVEFDAFKKQLQEGFASVNEKSHPIGTKSWLHVWRDLEKYVLGVDNK